MLDVPALGRLDRSEGRRVAMLDRSLRLGGLESAVDGATLRLDTRATVGPDRRLHLTLSSGTDSLHGTLPGGDTVQLPSLWPLRLAFGGGLRVGTTAQALVFDPFSAALQKLALRVTAESTFVVADSADFDSTTMAWIPVRFDTVRAFRVDDAGDGPLSAWIDAQGRVVRATTPLGYAAERTAFEIAYENFRRRDTLELLHATAAPEPNDLVPATLAAAGLRPDSGVGRLRIRLGGGALDGLDLSGGRQRLSGDTLFVQRESAGALRPRYLLPNVDPALTGDLAPDLLISSQDLRVVAQARLLAGRDRNPIRVTTLLSNWVAREVGARGPAGLADAASVLEDRRGDADGHTLLFVAMARALGLPARPVTGVVRASGGGPYYYHTWAEVYLGDWVAVDPTFGEFPADAAHLRLVSGRVIQPTDLTLLLGRLTLDPR